MVRIRSTTTQETVTYLHHTTTAPFIDPRVFTLRRCDARTRRTHTGDMKKILAAGLAALAVAGGVPGAPTS
jgi:hypothetical protein